MEEKKKTVSKYFFYLISACYATEGIVDVVVGSAWPVIAHAIKADISLIGILVMMYYLGAAVTSPITYKIRHLLGTNYSMVVSQIFFGLALFSYMMAPNVYIFAIGMFVNGVGCGLMEVNASSYVLKAYDVKEESILYSFWGLGSVIGATVMALAIKYYPPYKKGFMALIVVLIINIILLLFAKMSWQRQKKALPEDIVKIHSVSEEEKKTSIKIFELLKNKKVILIFICFMLSQSVIIVFNSLVSTIAVDQGNMLDSTAVAVPIIYFAAIFLGRAIFGNLSKRISTIKALKANSLIAAALIFLLHIGSTNSVAVCTTLILIGLTTAPIIPFSYAYIKEKFDVTLLSALIGYGDVFGIIGVILLSFLTTFVMQKASVQNVELVFAVIMGILYLLLTKIEKE